METASTLARDGDGENSPLDGDVREISRPISDLEMLTLGENCFTEQEVAKKIDSVPINRESSEGREIVTGSEGTEAMAQLVERSSPWTKKQSGGVAPEASIEIANGVASMEIPEEIFDEAELL